MEQCKDCVHFKYINKGLETNYAGCEKCSISIGNPYKCNAFKRFTLWQRIVRWFNRLRIKLYLSTNGKIDFGIGKQFKKFEDTLALNTGIN